MYMTGLEKDIITTLCYFVTHQHPLTKNEIFHQLWTKNKRSTLEEIEESLLTLEKKKYIECLFGYYVLSGHSNDVHTRREKEKWKEKKYEIAKKVMRLCALVPYVRGIYLCNTVATATAKKESDIDVFVVVSHGRLWGTRLVVTALVSILQKRRTKHTVADKICLSFYVTTKQLGLSSIALANSDIYLMYWITFLIPIYDSQHILQSIHKANNWITQSIPRARAYCPVSTYQSIHGKFLAHMKKVLERMGNGKLGDWYEYYAAQLQRKRMTKNKTSLQYKSDTRVVISNTMLKFHETDKRQWYKDEWDKQCRLWLAEKTHT